MWVANPVTAAPPARETIIFLGGYASMVLVLGFWARWLARHIDSIHLQRHLRRFNWMMFIARIAVAVWFGVGLFDLDWGQFVLAHGHWLTALPIDLPISIVATLPAYLAWMGLWWAQYPAEMALREQSLLIHLENDMPVHAPPGFWSYFKVNLRLQILFTLIPVIMILGLRDIAALVFWKFGMAEHDSRVEPFLLLGSSAAVFILAPVFLKSVLHTQPLPDSPLRRRLEELCRKSRLRFRDILLWHTDNNMGNAAVMGLIPQVRYVLLSDLLLETMTDQQVEAVFAHELGHIVHRHMAWYVVLVIILMLGMSIGEIALNVPLTKLHLSVDPDLVTNVVGVGLFFLLFGFLSRRFERQADVYAARTIERHAETPLPTTSGPGHVGQYGAAIFSSALYRVAVVNNIPIAARNFSHGSIEMRLKYLNDLANNPRRTDDFDRFMILVYSALLLALALFSSFAWLYRDKLAG